MSRLFRFPWRSADRIRRELDEELAFHLAERARELEAAGLSPGEAASRARRAFGDLDATRRYCETEDRRGETGLRWRTLAAEAWQDAGYGLRQLRRAPGVAAAAILTLALGIGANAAIFSAVHHILIAHLPYPDQARLVTLWQRDAQAGADVPLSPANFVDWRTRSTSLQSIAVAIPYGYNLTGDHEPARLSAWRVTEGFFEALGALPVRGRTFARDEHDSSAANVVVLGHRVWQQRFAGERAVVGRTITLDGAPYTVVGVMGPRFRFPTVADVYTPARIDPTTRSRGATYVRGVARLAPGATLEQAQAEADGIWRDLAERYPRTNRQMTARIIPLHEHLTAAVRPVLMVLLGAVGLVLLIACTNVANLLLARGVARRRELCVRLALGAGRTRIVRQLLVESCVLAGAGLAAGVALASAAVGAIRRFAPGDLPRLDEVRLDLPVLGFAVALALLTAVACGLAPAWQLGGLGADAALREQGAGALRLRAARGFVAAEVALAMVLLVGAGLLVRSLARVMREELGFAPEHRLALTAHFWEEFPDTVRRSLFVQQAEERLRALPGVRSAGAANALPLSREGSDMDPPFVIEGRPVLLPGEEPSAILTIATPGYFGAMGIALRRGRLFTPADGPTAPGVMLISETMARRFWPGEDPLGQRVRALAGSVAGSREIVGVVADVRHAGHEEAPRPELYVAHAQNGFGSMTFVMEAPGDAGSHAAAAQRAVLELHPRVLFDAAERLDGRLAETLAPRRFALFLMAAFAILAAVLAAIGVYGLFSFAVAQRTGEIGVRMALGADARAVAGMVLREGMALGATGVALGTAGAALLTQAMRRLLYGISPIDPLTFLTLAAVALAAAAAACWVPARRAARVSPVDAMRA